MERRASGVLLVFLSAVGFGTLGIFGRVTVSAELALPTLLLFRFVFAAAIVWALLRVRARRRKREREQEEGWGREWNFGTGPRDGLGGRLLLVELGLGVVYGGMTIAFFESLAWLSAGVATLLLYTYPVLVAVVATGVLDESVTVPKALALGCTVSGVGLIAGLDGLALSALGVALVGLASIGYATYAIGTRAMAGHVPPLVHSGYVLLGAAATIAPYGLLEGTLSLPATGTAWGLIGGITLVATVVPLLAFNEGLARIEASSASIVSTAEPLTTVVLGTLLLGESADPRDRPRRGRDPSGRFAHHAARSDAGPRPEPTDRSRSARDRKRDRAARRYLMFDILTRRKRRGIPLSGNPAAYCRRHGRW
jgi:drug/metabolite transporter (DMT)-like permease